MTGRFGLSAGRGWSLGRVILLTEVLIWRILEYVQGSHLDGDLVLTAVRMNRLSGFAVQQGYSRLGSVYRREPIFNLSGFYSVAWRTCAFVFVGGIIMLVAWGFLNGVRQEQLVSGVAGKLKSGGAGVVVDDLYKLAEIDGRTTDCLLLSKEFWEVINKSGQVAKPFSGKPTEKSDRIILHALKYAMNRSALERAPVSTYSLLRTSKNVFRDSLTRQCALVEIAMAQFYHNPVSAYPLLIEFPRLDNKVLDKAPGYLVGISYFLNGMYPELVNLRKKQVPALKGPLTSGQQFLLILEAQATQVESGTTQAAVLASDFIRKDLVTDSRGKEILSQIAAGELLGRNAGMIPRLSE